MNFRIPLRTSAKLKPTYGFTAGYGQQFGSTYYDGRSRTRQITFADVRFSGDGLERARVASFDLANPRGRRLNLTGEGDTLWIVVGLVAAGVAICLLADCFEGDDDEHSGSPSPSH